MGWRDDDRADRQALTAATREVASEIRATRRTLEPDPPDELGHKVYPRNAFQGIPGVALALRFCRDGDTSLARLMKQVPAENVIDEESVRRVRCLCGEETRIEPGWTECGGDCGRFFVADYGSVWSVRLPVEA